MTDLITGAIDRLASGSDLSFDETAAVLAEIMGGNATEIQIAGFLIALRCKGETVEELAGLARTMRSFATKVEVAEPGRLLDTAGTGGGRRTFNVSTTAALIAAGAGLRGCQARQPLGERAYRARRICSKRSARGST